MSLSSLSFEGNAGSYLLIPSSADINFGTEDFTIEWLQYQTDSNPFPRIFQIGSYGEEDVSIGVSIEGGQMYYWVDNTPIAIAYLPELLTSYKETWISFAICRTDSTTQVYMNGEPIGSAISGLTDFNSSVDLVISNETLQSDGAAFGGYMTYFHWVKGLAKYTSAYTPTIPSVISQTVLLLTANSFSGTGGSTTENVNVGVYTPPTPPPVIIPRIPMYTNNSMVFYKPGSLAAGGVSTVRNSRHKSKRT